MQMLGSPLIAGVSAGILAGFVAGLLGLSPGGILVPVTILVTGCEQHVAQGISLICQMAPTSASAIRRYQQHQAKPAAKLVLPLMAGFLAGEILGAVASGGISGRALQWTYVGYLLLLEVVLLSQRQQALPTSPVAPDDKNIKPLGLLAVGLVAGFSSGFMGIGGGLALVIGLSRLLKMQQHRAQAVSLVLGLLPLTAPAALIYWQQGWRIPWPLACAIVVGLFLGNDAGARLALRLAARRLQQALAALVLFFAAYMAAKALGLT